MKKVLLVSLILFGVQATAWSQKDTLKIHGSFNLQGMLQSGNLNQIGGNTHLNAEVYNSKWSFSVSGSYNYVAVQEINVINDLWTYSVLKYAHKKRFYPVTMGYYGFAKSFGIKKSVVAGGGYGLNLIQKEQNFNLQVNLLAGYLNTVFLVNEPLNKPVLLSFIKGNFPLIRNKLSLNWEFHSYNSFQKNDIYGFQNTLRWMIPITTKLNIIVSNFIVYTNTTDVNKKPLNTSNLLGVSARF